MKAILVATAGIAVGMLLNYSIDQLIYFKTCEARYEHLQYITDNRPDADLERRMLALQNEMQQLRLSINGIVKECGK